MLIGEIIMTIVSAFLLLLAIGKVQHGKHAKNKSREL